MSKARWCASPHKRRDWPALCTTRLRNSGTHAPTPTPTKCGTKPAPSQGASSPPRREEPWGAAQAAPVLYRVPYTTQVTTPWEKGNALEAAVAAIEHHILSTSPALREKTFLIESKKIVLVGGVHHEIDIFVTTDLGDGYKSVFIFECKNWEDAVGKNEIIIFAEKIAATQTQTGFFVAKSFTRDAYSQAATNPRIRLVTALEHEPTTAPLPSEFHQLILTTVHAEAMFHVRDGGTQVKTIDLATAVTKLRGESIDLRSYLQKWQKRPRTRMRFRSDPNGIRMESMSEALMRNESLPNRSSRLTEKRSHGPKRASSTQPAWFALP
jgi:Restriction endonuclease